MHFRCRNRSSSGGEKYLNNQKVCLGDPRWKYLLQGFNVDI